MLRSKIEPAFIDEMFPIIEFIESLCIYFPRLPPRLVGWITDCKRLYLELDEEGGIVELTQSLPSLEELTIKETYLPVTTVTLFGLQECANLKKLDLEKTSLSEESILQFMALRPDISVTRRRRTKYAPKENREVQDRPQTEDESEGDIEEVDCIDE